MEFMFYVCCMEIETSEKKSVKVEDLYSISNYAKKLGIRYNAVVNKIGSGHLKSIWISGTQFIIHNEKGDK